MSGLTSVDIIGAGPAGLYTAILLRQHLRDVRVCITEQNARDATFGFGIVFSDQVLDALKADDPETHDFIVPHMEPWRNMTLSLPKGREEIDGVGLSATGRLELNEILAKRAEELGATIHSVIAVTTAVLGVCGISAAFIGWLHGPAGLVRRGAIALAGIALLLPPGIGGDLTLRVNGAGLVLLAIL